MKKVVVTGAGGFIGRQSLGLLLDRGFIVHAVDIQPPVMKKQNLFWHSVDLHKPDEVEKFFKDVKPEYLLHFAWYAVPGKYWTSLENFRWVQSSIEILRRFHESGGRRAVFSGTCAEYDWNFGTCREYETPRNPVTVYGTCKHALQIMVDAYSKETGLSTAWGRVFFLYGPYEYPSRLIAFVIRSLLKGEAACCTHGGQQRDFLFVKDVAGAFVSLLESDVRGAVNISSGEPVALKDVLLKIGDKTGRPELINLGAIPPGSGEPDFLIGDNTRLRNEVGWSPEYGLDTGLEETVRWWKNEMSGAYS
ncbi:MAG: NAD(P)-dependent oxidoreductase [Chloroflexi bacterium]|nr:NAD(P)-dependent oxidoreductase [Chloroflexota bacterium]